MYKYLRPKASPQSETTRQHNERSAPTRVDDCKKRVGSTTGVPGKSQNQQHRSRREVHDEKTFDFETLLTKYRAMRESQIAENKGGNYNSHNLKGIIAKLRNTVICTKGMTQPGGVEKWIKMYPKVTARKSIVNMLNELKVFMNQFKGVIANLKKMVKRLGQSLETT